MIGDTHAYLRKGRNLLKAAGNDPTIRAKDPRETATIAESTKRSFQLYLITHCIAFIVDFLLS